MADTLVTVPAPSPYRLRLHTKSSVQAGMLDDFTKGELYEPGTFQTFVDLLKPGDTVLDVGAHVGVFTCLAASLVGPSGHVYAFEPDPANRRRLHENVALNGFENVTIDKRVVANRTDSLAFFRCADNDGGHALWNPARSSSNTKTRAKSTQRIVQSMTIDGLSVQPTLIKIDTEGAELTVLEGALHTLTHWHPIIIAEINAFGLGQMGADEDQLRTLLRSFGYQEYGIQDAPPYRVPLTPGESLQQSYVEDNRLRLPVFNMAFLPA